MFVACAAPMRVVSADAPGAVAAVELVSDDGWFGGWSAATLAPTGELVLVSDIGHWAAIELDRVDGVLVGAKLRGHGRLRAPDGRPLSGKWVSDAEAFAVAPGHAVVAFERSPKLWDYGQLPPVGAPVAIPLPDGFRAPENGGIEAAAWLGGALVFVVEGDEDDDGPHAAWVRDGATWRAASLARTDGFRPVELAPMGPDLLLVSRAWDGEKNRTRLARLPAATIAGPGPWAPIELTTLSGEWVENFEGAAVGDDAIWLVSDDNFSRSQRTLIVQVAR